MVKAKKKNLSEFAQKKRIQQTKKKTLNPFEIHVNKDKHSVLGKKSKADRGLPGVSRAKAIDIRKKTLLPEYKLKNKSNVFLDKRIGEKNFHLSAEEKTIARFAAERVKAHKKSNIFNLNDDEVLTHRGQTLEEIEKFDDPKSDDEYSDNENDKGKLDKSFVREAHFGGGILSKPNSAMSRKDLIEQLIIESKKRKAEKQKIREQTMDLTEKLDSEWTDLLPIITACKRTQKDVEKKIIDDFDLAVRELKYEARGKPTDKLKSEDDIIKEEKEKLEALEQERLARMRGSLQTSNEIKHKSADELDDGFYIEEIEEEEESNEKEKLEDGEENKSEGDSDDDDDDDEENENEDEDENGSKGESEGEREGEGEGEEGDGKGIDEDEDTGKKKEKFVEKNQNKKLEIDEKANSDDEKSEAEDESSSEEDNFSDLKESDDSSSEDESMPGENTKKISKKVGRCNKENTTNEKKIISKSSSDLQENSAYNPIDKKREHEIRADLQKRKEIMEQARKELPYTYKAPENYSELKSYFKDYNAEYVAVIVDRVIKCNHSSLHEDNKEKLANFYVYLLQYVNDCASVDTEKEIIQCFQVFDRLCPYFYDLTQANPQNAKICIQEIVKEKHEEFENNKKVYPGLDTLIFFKLVSLLFPTSDYRHPVVTPCLVFMSQILLRCRIRNRKDISRGLFICTLILEYTTLSKRFCPAVINFLRGILFTATPTSSVSVIKTIPPFKNYGNYSNSLVLESDQSNLQIDPKMPHMKAIDLIEDKIEDDFKVRAVLTAINLLFEFRDHLQELDSVYQIFEPIAKLLKLNGFSNYPENCKKHVENLYEELNLLKNKKLEYIVLEKKRPKALRQLEPRIEKVYDGKKHKPMSKEKAEREKLLHKYKREMKGAIREIRRDRDFLAKVQIKQQIQSDNERKRKVKEIFGEAAVQQHELNKIKRKK